MIEALSRSIIVRLALGIGLSIFLLATGTGAFLYVSVRNTVNASVHQDLQDAAKHVLHRLVDEGHPVDKELLELGDHLSIRVADREGRLLLESPGMSRMAPADLYPLPGRVRGVQEGRKALGHRFKLMDVEYPRGWIQILRNDETERALLHSFRMHLYAVLAGVPLLAALLGLALAKRGLKPVETLARTVGGIRPETLGTRLDAMDGDRELLPLVVSVNGALERLETAFARLRELNADLAHELRTPLHLLRLELEELLTRGGLAPEQADAMGSMMETLQHLSAVIEQMLFLARTEDPTSRVLLHPLSAAELLDRVREDFLLLADERDVPIRVEAVDPSLQVQGDALLLRRALHNLVANAIRHSSSGRTIALRAWRQGAEAILEVEDQGEGIPPELLPRLGKRFIRQDASRDRRTGGAGLGLAIVHGIAQLHGGSLEFASDVGLGTRVRVRLLLPDQIVR